MDLRLRPEQRAELSRPLGPVLATPEARARLTAGGRFVTCGDVVTANAVAWGTLPFAAVVDRRTLRDRHVDPKELGPLEEGRRLTARNPAGEITEELQRAVRDLVQGGGLLVVDGEEDLAVLPLVRELPEGTSVLYGQPGAGVCFLEVDASMKRHVQRILDGMETRPSTHGH